MISLEIQGESVKVANIRTSDRVAFKRCRRKWDLSSGLRRNLTDTSTKSALWLGTGFHYAMEDFHGYNKYEHPVKAFEAYIEAYGKAKLQLPANIDEDRLLGISMLEYYVEWLKGRSNLKTYIHNGVPQVEVKFEIPIPVPADILAASGYDAVVYSGVLDRVVIDEQGRLWVLDYKTAAKFSVDHLDTDPQVTAYCWAGQVLYHKPVTGAVWQQHLKKVAGEPTFLSSGRFSVAKTQATTHRMYTNALIGKYGSLEEAPAENRQFLVYLASQESNDVDAIIRRDHVFRNAAQIESEGVKIMAEAIDMINPKLPMYSNPTRDCTWDCSFRDTCISMDDGSDWEAELASYTMSRNVSERWREFV